MDNCLSCGKPIAEPGVAYGYAGPICHCTRLLKIQQPLRKSGQLVYVRPDDIEKLRSDLQAANAIANQLAQALKDHYKILYGEAPYSTLKNPCPTAKALIAWEEHKLSKS